MYSVIRMGSRGTFVHCTASSRCMRIDAAERHYLVKVGHRLSTVRLSTGQYLLQSQCSSGTAHCSNLHVCSKHVNWTCFCMQSWDGTYHQTYSQCVSLSQRPQGKCDSAMTPHGCLLRRQLLGSLGHFTTT